MSIRRELDKRRQSNRASRATEEGISGHKEAMDAIARAAGHTPTSAGDIRSSFRPERNKQTGELSGPIAPGKERIFKVNRPMTWLFGGGKSQDGDLVGKDVDVKSGSRKASRLKKRFEEYNG